MSTQDTPVIDDQKISSEKVDNALFTDESTPVTKTEETVEPTKTEGEKPTEEVGAAGGEEVKEAGVDTEKKEDFDGLTSSLSESEVESVKAFAKENKLSKEAAQKLIDDKQNFISSQKVKEQETLKEQQGLWLERVKADKEIGGENLDKSVALAKMALEKYAPAEFRKTLDDTGLGNHPEVLRTFARIGKSMQSDIHVTAPKSEAAKVKEDYEYLYGSKN